MHVAEHPAGKRGVEELRPVVGTRPPSAEVQSTPSPPATRLHRHAQHTVVSDVIASAAASAQASSV